MWDKNNVVVTNSKTIIAKLEAGSIQQVAVVVVEHVTVVI